MKFFVIFMLLISCTFSNSHYIKCDLIHEINSSNQEQRCYPRPTNDTYAPSPNNLFHIHYDLSGNDAPLQTDNNSNGIPDYVDEVGIASEYSLDVFINELGFNTLIPDDDGIYDIFISDRGSGSYGINYIDLDDDCIDLGGSSWVEIDNAYEQGQYYTSGLDAMRVTIAHELFHAIQRSYQIRIGSESNRFLFEMTSTWVEDIVYPDINDYIYWTDDFFDDPQLSISQTNGYSIAFYALYLTSQFNNNIIKEIWERHSVVNNGVSSINYVLDNNYNTNFINTWVDFCSRNFFNGEYIDMNNNFYYYADQVYAEPITFNTSEQLNGNTSIVGLLLNDESINIKLFEPTSNLIIDNIQSTVTAGTGTLIGDIVLSSNILYNQNIVDINNSSGLCAPVEQIYMVLASTQNSEYDIDIITTDSVVYSDFNQDCQTNILDIIILVDVILNNYNGGSTIPSELEDACDLDNNGIIDILDIVLLINEIMDI